MFTPTNDGRIRLDFELAYPVWEVNGVTFRVTVPAGFISDGASIPRLLWSLIGPPIGSNHLIPAVVHDYLCEEARIYPQRLLADAVFFCLLKQHNVPAWKRCLMYLGVRWYGRFVWKPGAINGV